MRIPLREHDEITFPQADGLLSYRMPPACAARDDVVLDDALGTRHHRRGDQVGFRSFGDPRCAQLEVEVDGPGQPHRAEDV